MIAPDPSLVLREIHHPAAPSWWPPAPGWWLVGGMVALCIGLVAWRVLRRRHRMHALARSFDTDIAAASTPAARIAAASSWLRRAARERDPAAATLQGEAWLEFVGADGDQLHGTLLLDGAFRRDVDALQADALVAAARRRVLAWSARR